MANPIEIYYGAELLFRFNPSPTNLSVDIQKTGVSTMDLPTYIRPWAFDFTTQERRITLNAMLINTDPVFDTFSVRNRGTGSILDQIEDLLYIASGNWCRHNPGQAQLGSNLLYLVVPYNGGLYSGHILASDYQSSDNSDYQFDNVSVPCTIPSAESYPQNLPLTNSSGNRKYDNRQDKIYYAYPTGLGINRDTASVNRVPVTLSFIEVQDTILI